jgi:hypothetical protein
VEDRIYRSLRTAQERELQSHPSSSPSEPSPAPAPAASLPVSEAPVAIPVHVAPASAVPASHWAPPASAVPTSHGATPTHATVRPAEPFGLHWLGRGSSAERPRISVVGTLSLSVLISAGLFASQLIFKSHQKNHDASVAANSTAAIHVAAQQSADSDDDASAPVSVPSHFRHVHAPAHSRTHSTHAVAADDEPAADETPSEEVADGETASKSHRHAAASHPVRHAAEEADVTLPGDNDGSSQPVDRSAAAPIAPVEHAAPEFSAQASAAPFAPATVQSTVAQPPSAQPSSPVFAQPVAAANAPPTISAAGLGQPMAGAMQISADSATANQPTLTIVPGRPDNIGVPSPAPAIRPQPPVQATVQPIVQPAPMSQQAHVEPALTTIQPASATVQPAVNPFETLDRTKVMSFQFRNAPWSLVLARFANATGLELRLQAMPDGTFNRWDSARYTPSQTLAILNSELAKLGCQAKVVGTALCVVPATGGEAAIQPVSQVSASVPSTTGTR